jgi:hypothetical protein
MMQEIFRCIVCLREFRDQRELMGHKCGPERRSTSSDRH